MDAGREKYAIRFGGGRNFANSFSYTFDASFIMSRTLEPFNFSFSRSVLACSLALPMAQPKYP